VLASTIITCEGREGQLEKTRSQARAFGLDPLVLSTPCSPPSVEDNLWKAYMAAHHAWEGGTGLLFLEDDVDLAPDFPRFLQMAEDLGEVTTFILFRESLYPGPEYVNPREPVVPRLVRLVRSSVRARRGFHGSQALYLPPKAVEAVLRDAEHFVTPGGLPLETLTGSARRHGFDFWVKDKADDIYCAFPNPVQHREEVPSTFSGKVTRFKSRSYNLERDWT